MMKPKGFLFITATGPGEGFGEQELHDAYHGLIESEEAESLLCESCSLKEFDDLYNPGASHFEIREAVTFKHYPALKKGLNTLAREFAQNLKGTNVALSDFTRPADLKPRKNRLFAYVAAEFSFSDGQSVKMMFHSPGGDSRKFDMDDALVSYAYTLNKRDVTHLFAEKRGLSIPQFVKRMTQILLKNSEKFQKRQTNLAETKQQLAEAEAAATELENQIVMANDSAATARQGNEDSRLEIKSLETRIEDAKKEKERLEGLLAKIKPKTPEVAPEAAAAEKEASPGQGGASPEPAAASENKIWEKPDKELQAMNIGAVQKSYQALMDGGQDVEALTLLAKAVGNKTNFKDARALLNQKKKAGDLDGHHTDRLEKLKNNLEDKMTARMTSSTHVPPEETEQPVSPEMPATPPEAQPPETPAPAGGDLAAQAREQIAKGNDILAGKYDDDPDELLRVYNEMLDFYEANSADATVKELVDLDELLDKTGDYHTALLAQQFAA